ncbi:transcription initiation factor IIB-2-like [Hibiscus syriacus]|uniref:Transcription initiation factor IIB-2-like n=1 Tax=Hibiscus syriacus TaxID=106335 RepID=A0A6A2X6K7_HIBSY|nr:transcription initiation factor IIB-2-like [Hibiscus syriacus]
MISLPSTPSPSSKTSASTAASFPVSSTLRHLISPPQLLSMWTPVGPFGGYHPMLSGLLPHLGFCRRIDPSASGCGDVLVHAFGAHAMSFFNTANVVTAVRNFPDYSGTAVGIMKGFLGLSGAILIQVYETMFNNKPTSYLLLLALLPAINPLLLMWFVRIYDTNEPEEKKLLDDVSCVALLVAAYLMSVIILDHLFDFRFLVRIFTFVVLLLLLSSPLFIVLRAGERDSPPSMNRSLISEEQRDFQEEDKYNLNLLQAMCSVEFWILFFAMACGMGSGLATVNNLGQIGESLGYSSFEANTLVSLWSIWNFLGRFGAGCVSDHFLHVKGWARPLFMVLTLATMSIGHSVIASGLPGALYAGSILVGVCYGSQWSLMPTIASEIFGVRHMGTIFNTITVASPVGSYIFSVRVVGYIYDLEASGSGCKGRHCFMLSFLIMASATLLGTLAALALFYRTKRFYSQVILGRLLHSL